MCPPLHEAEDTAMTHLVRFKNGDEFDALTRGGRRYHRFRAGTRAAIKRRFRRRERRVFKTTGDSISRFDHDACGTPAIAIIEFQGDTERIGALDLAKRSPDTPEPFIGRLFQSLTFDITY